MYRPARLRKVVSAAPLLPRSSLSTWTRNCWPGVMRSAMLGRRPSASAWSALSGFVNSSREISLAGRNPWRSEPNSMKAAPRLGSTLVTLAW